MTSEPIWQPDFALHQVERGFHTAQAYSILGLTILLYTTSLASIEQPNIVQHTTFRSLVAFKAIILQWLDHVNLELTYVYPQIAYKRFPPNNSPIDGIVKLNI